MISLKIKLGEELSLDDIEELTNALEKFNSNILLISQNQQANCKSLINLLAIGISYLKVLDFKISGSDEEAVVEYLNNFFSSIKK